MNRIKKALLPCALSQIILLSIVWFVNSTPAQQSTAPQSAVQQSELYVCPMHPDVQSKTPGKCPKCGMTLLRRAQQPAAPPPAVQQSEIYVCPMHPDVQSKTPGKCPKCGMTLLRQPPGIAGQYEVVLKATPAVIKPGEMVKLNFTIFHPKSQEQAKQFNIVHEKIFHLFIVSQDLGQFQHIHPIQQPDGSFVVETVLPKPGAYKAYCDFFPVGGTPQVIRKSLTTAGFSDKSISSQANLMPDQELTRSVDGIRFELTTKPFDLVSGKLTYLKYHLVYETTGQPVTDLQPYLGAWGHTFILSEDLTDSLHAHPESTIPEGIDRSRLISGSDITFETFFRRPGRYRIWSQFQHENKVSTVSFTVNVSPLDKVAKWNGNSWSGLPGTTGIDMNRTVHAIAVSGTDVYVGGDFTSIGGISAYKIAKWDGHTWSALGNGIDNGIVYAIAVSGSDVYVGGTFTAASGMKVNRIAKWDGHSWSALSSGINACRDPYCSPTVYALAASGSNIYVGGQFASAGEIAADGIAKWNGSSWSSVGNGVRAGARDGLVMALALNRSDLYAGGKFITAGEVNAHNIAKWNGSTWSAMGSGIHGDMERVRTIAINGSDVYVGGAFSTAGGVSVHNIARWNGSDWSAFGINPEEVYAIAVTGIDIYVSGSSFNIPGETIMRGIVKWNGKNWSALGKGIALIPVLAIRVSGHDVYVGGG